MWRVCCVLVLLLVGVSTGHTQEKDDFVMERPVSPDETLVIGGRRVQDARKWPATFKFGKKEGNEAREFCTATAVGPRVLLTAAHCLPNGAAGHAVIKDTRVRIVCDHHPEYTPCPRKGESVSNCPSTKTTSADYALCLATTDFSVKEYETLNTNSSVPELSSEVTLTGFGCNKDGGTDGGFGYLFEGETKVQALANENGPEKWSIYYILTKGGAALCYGDSGGPSYKLFDADGKSRLFIGVNSRSRMAEGDLSYLSATNVVGFVRWAENWAKDKSSAQYSVKICGIHPGVRGCHP